MITSKQRAELRAQANPLDVTLIVGKGGITEELLAEASRLLDSHELIKCRVLESAMLTAAPTAAHSRNTPAHFS